MTRPQGPHRTGALGVLMLETRFPRPRGDIGNPASFDFPVIHRVVRGAVPEEIVAPAARAGAWLPAFADAARALEAEGAAAITTSCGFLVLAQAALASAVRVPVLSSALLLAPLIRTMLGPEARIGVLTAHSGHLGPPHLAAAGIGPDWPVTVRGLEDCPAFAASVLANAPDMDVEAVRDGTVAAARAMQAAAPDLAAILMECTNLPPHAAAVRAATGLPVWSILDAAALLMGRQFTLM